MARELPPPFKLTDTAREYLAAQLAKSPAAKGLRVSVKTTGCSGYSTEFSFCEAAKPGDLEAEVAGIRFFVDPLAGLHTTGATLDLIRQGLNTRLDFTNNPNIDATCGCGESYTVKTSPKP